MAGRVLTIDLDKIEHNTRSVVGLCTAHDIGVTGVTKGVCGAPEVARAMLRGGVRSIGESRLENVRRLREAGVDVPVLLLRMPSLSDVDEVVALTETSLNAELAVLAALSRAAATHGRWHDVVVMVDLGDLREGIWPDRLLPFVQQALELPGVRVAGLGTNLTCFGGVLPTDENMGRLVALVDEVEHTLGLRLDVVSGGNSSALPLIAAGGMPARVNHVRIGEAILLGRETGHRRPWPGTVQDAVVLHGEIVELQRKPSLPIGPRGEDAMGRTPTFTDRGTVDHALVNIGVVDTDVSGITPLDDRLRVLGASSDYLVLDATGAHGELRVGDQVGFTPGYGALVTAASSPYVDVHFGPTPGPV